MTKRTAATAAIAFLLAVFVAFALDDLARIACFAPGFGRGALGVVSAAACAALLSGASSRSARDALFAAVTTATFAFLFVRMPTPWIDLGPFGAGALTALTVIVLPITVSLGAAITRGASRTPPSSRRPSRRR